MRTILAVIVFALVPQTHNVSSSVPVLVELFTSEGCSSCPPADQLLSVLVTKQPVAGVTVIGLELHVDYWDALGWKDPASLGGATARQQAYSRVFGADRVYTPQMVVDGRDELIGSDQGAARRAIDRAVRRPHARVEPRGTVDGTTAAGEVVVTGIPADAAKETLEATLVLTENNVTTEVKRGENGGRTLHHDALVRQIVGLGRVVGSEPLRWHVPLQAAWQRDRLNAVVFVQSRKSLRIWGAGIAPLR
jgi:hypothetical protein